MCRSGFLHIMPGKMYLCEYELPLLLDLTEVACVDDLAGLQGMHFLHAWISLLREDSAANHHKLLPQCWLCSAPANLSK